ncbi:MAG TPA: hypothetical protein VGZ22_21155 [Isosphaeraceae bacterium]|jgi:hypothetical protein|nr:hypothetical protein [Isosphaeraceae bacterium]
MGRPPPDDPITTTEIERRPTVYSFPVHGLGLTRARIARDLRLFRDSIPRNVLFTDEDFDKAAQDVELIFRAFEDHLDRTPLRKMRDRWLKRALDLLADDECYAWLHGGSNANNPRITVLTELGQLKDVDMLKKLAGRICAKRLHVKEAIKLIRCAKEKKRQDRQRREERAEELRRAEAEEAASEEPTEERD